MPLMNETEKRAAIALLEKIKKDQELAQEKKFCEESLYHFAKSAWHIVEPVTTFGENWHIEVICQHLEAAVRGDIKNLLINIPPGCMKSLLTSVFLPAWVWGPANWPEARFMFVSYFSSLSVRDSIKCRNIITSPWYQERWGEVFKLVGDQNAKTKYENNHRGWRLSTSVGGAGTGEHPDLIILDDPHNVQQSESEVERQSAIEWIDGTLTTRGQIRAVRKICAMQRLHHEDAAGHFLAQDTWEHLKIPMEYEPDNANPETSLGWKDPRTEAGELLWPGMFTRERVDEMRLSMGESRAAGQFQQRPPEHYEQNEWPRHYFEDHIWFEDWPPPGEFLFKVIALDPSKGKRETADYSAFVMVALHESGIMYVDAYLERLDYQKITEKALELGASFNPDGFVVESNLYQGMLCDMISEQSKRVGFGLPIYADHSKTNKIERIRRLTPYLARENGNGDFRFKKNSPGALLLVNQLKSFPAATHDDGPDALEKAVCLIRKLYNAEY